MLSLDSKIGWAVTLLLLLQPSPHLFLLGWCIRLHLFLLSPDPCLLYSLQNVDLIMSLAEVFNYS